jgi:hypothetical protein
MKKVLLTLGLAFAMSSVGSAATLCTSLLGTDVTTIGSCSIGNVTFSNFQIISAVNITPTVVLGAGTGSNSGGYFLGFQLSHVPQQTQAGADFILGYEVWGPTSGIEMFLGNASNMGITEVACTNPFAGPAGTTCLVPPAASYTINVSRPAPPGTTFASATFPTMLPHVYIQKDLSFGANGSISDFINGHTIPEPTTSLLMGTALLGLALLRKRRAQK